ncbi:MAG TPA: response regulator [Methylomirabilota bacterium]|nr:response regulator [Methylomirabilota bacterium]
MNPIRILLVEDDSNDVLLVKTILAEETLMSIAHAQRLADALAVVVEQTFDVILLDLGLPDSHGLETFAELHKKARTLPIIILSVKGDMDTARKAIHDGAQDFIPKTELTGLLLARTIRYAIERQQLEAEREKLIGKLQAALAEVKTLSGLLPICADCKKVRDDTGYWNQIETYIARYTDASFSHGLCPQCAIKSLESTGVQVSDKMRNAAKY